MATKPLSVYVHYPFCKSKCPYCDFNSHVSQNIDHKNFEQCYINEIDFFGKNLENREIKTIFFGGGTPSLMPISLVEAILNRIAKNWKISNDCEITLETNPTSYESAKFLELKKTGINRLSIGIQALNNEDLKFLGRNHSSQEAISVIKNTAQIFDNFSFDLIYARPKQKAEEWLKEIELALSFGSKHISLYQLTIEKGTPFFRDFADKKFTLPDEELSAEIYEKTNEVLDKNGFLNYEISNYAKKNFECKHNLVYWRGLDYIGVGAGAHSRVYLDGEKQRSAIMMTHKPQNWLDQVAKKGNGIQKIEAISDHELAQELILMGLRLDAGINDEIFISHFGKKLSEIVDYKALKNLENEGFLSISHDSMKITQKGKILTNSIINKVVQKLLI